MPNVYLTGLGKDEETKKVGVRWKYISSVICIFAF